MSKHFLMFFMFLSIVLGRGGTEVAAQWRANFSKPILTTDCCPERKQRIDSIMKNAPIVFEGRVVRSSGGSYLFEIEKIYRGEERLLAGTVEVIVKDPKEVIVKHPEEVIIIKGHDNFSTSLWGECIIFAEEIEESGSGAFDANNSIKLGLLDINYYAPSWFGSRNGFPSDVIPNEAMPHLRVSYYSGFGLDFETKQEVYDFLGTYGLFPTDFPKADKLPPPKTAKEIYINYIWKDYGYKTAFWAENQIEKK